MIVGVAIKIGDHIEIRLPKPNRHHDCFRYFHEITGVSAPSVGLNVNGKNQGFYTHTGRYLNRVQAGKYCQRIKQPTNFDTPGMPPFDGKPVCSEDLW